MGQSKITPCIWFNGNAGEATRFYLEAFKNSKVKNKSHYPDGRILTVDFSIEECYFLALNAGPQFKPNPAISFNVWCESADEIDRLWKTLSQDGDVLMDLGKTHYAEKYGWCEDKFGVSWQLFLAAPHKQKVTPALLFTQDKFGKAKSALNFYTSCFANSQIIHIAQDEKNGSVLHSTFTLAGQEFTLMESSQPHAFTFTNGVSLVVNCDDQKEIDLCWNKLSADPGAEQCGWLKDRFGISWQIVPRELSHLMTMKDPKKVEQVMGAMMKMKKLDLNALKAAAQS